jgi:DNA polymerase III alpha subunit (gram-positive type)
MRVLNLVVLNVCTTGMSVAEDDVFHVGARRVCTESGHVLDTFITHVRPDQQDMTVFRERVMLPSGSDADFAQMPSIAEALRELSKFVGDDLIVTHRGPVGCLPVIREKCARHGVATRVLRQIDSADLARKLLGDDVRLTVRELAKRLRLIYAVPEPLGPELYLTLVAEITQRLWALLHKDSEPLPMRHGWCVMPTLEPTTL